MATLDHLLAFGEIKALVQRATDGIAAVHRRPVNLRKYEVTSSESLLRGARTSAALDPELGEKYHISGYSMLAPAVIEQTSRTFLRAPLQVLARIDALAGGPGRPTSASAELEVLARVITSAPNPVLIPAVVHGEIIGRGAFGPRSALVARVAARSAAVTFGSDPRGLCVPETYLRRHRSEYQASAAHFTAGQEQAMTFIELYLKAMIAGAEEAESIAAAAR